MPQRKILYVVNVDWFFMSHRLPLAKEALKRGYTVTVLTKNTGKKDEIESHGIKFIDIDFQRSGKNPLNELGVFFQIYMVYKKVRPDLIHHVTIKPAIYGSAIIRLFKLKDLKFVNAISGLGYNFTAGRKTKFQIFLLYLMKYSFSNSVANFIFQNPDDCEFYTKLGFVNSNNHVIIKGSGVDENQFIYFSPPNNIKLKVILPARMLFDKGIKEFSLAAIELMDKWFGKAEFLFAGDIDPDNPASARVEDMERLLIADYIKWDGFQVDIRKVLAEADIVCLPSYREGLPKSLVEAMAIGRPIITTDTPGCRECVVEGINGYLVPVKDFQVLSNKIENLLLDKELRFKMGRSSREMMEKQMSLLKVIEDTFNFYDRFK
jgi:glycosyltransferase involved in cell wall biosynthesis